MLASEAAEIQGWARHVLKDVSMNVTVLPEIAITKFKKVSRISAHVLLALSLLTGLAGSAPGDIIPADRRITWQPGVLGGIPARTMVFTNFTSSATANQLNNAIANCPSNQVVLLQPGTYLLTNGLYIGKNGVTVRGAGQDQTILRFSASNGISRLVQFEGKYGIDPAPTVDWLGGYAKGTTSLTLSSVATSVGALAVGNILCIDQLNDPKLVSIYGNEGQNCTYCSRLSGTRAQMQYVQVTAINGNNVTISPGVYMTNWQASLSPQAWWWGQSCNRSGVEDLTIDNSQAGASFNVEFVACNACWVKSIRSIAGVTDHLHTYWCKSVEVRDSWFDGMLHYTSSSYGVDVTYSSDCLVENNILDSITTPLMLREGVSGNVLGYNFCHNMRYDPAPDWLIPCVSTHGAHPCMNLIEGNSVTSIYLDAIHGSSSHNTLFRNRAFGWDTNKSDNTYAIVMESSNRCENVVGNVLGTAGYHKYLEYNCTNLMGCPVQTVYRMGFFTTQCNTTSDDAKDMSTVLRHGNYDYATQSTIWDSSITETNIPASLYLTSKPSWWGNSGWPAFGPDLNPIAGVIPAQNRFISITLGSSAPSAPQNLRISGQ